jgi:SNF family Na+-dependent transporter
MNDGVSPDMQAEKADEGEEG